MNQIGAVPTKEDTDAFRRVIDENRFDFVKLAYLIFGFGEPGTEMEDIHPYDWQIEELHRISVHLQNPMTRYEVYKLAVSSGNGSAKTALGAIIAIILLYTHKLRGRVTANTKPQLSQIVWPEYDVWLRRARYNEFFFTKLGESIQANDNQLGKSWRFDMFTWDEASPTHVSGLHNKGHAILYIFEEAAGIPANIFKYASGAFTDVDTIKIWLAFGNSDEPESYFEQILSGQVTGWRTRRIDTRTLKHVDKNWIAALLRECGGNEDHDDFRVRVRGLPRKSNKDSIIHMEAVEAAIERGYEFDPESVSLLPSILTIDPAWTGGDETVIWHHQGPYSCLLERYKLDKSSGQDHSYTYNKAVYWEKKLKVDEVRIDQAEGTALKTLANQHEKHHWILISFANSPNDTPEFKDSEYANMRAQMYYESNRHLLEGAIITAVKPEWLADVKAQLCWTKGGRHKINLKKLAEPKKDIKERVGQSPDVADGFVLRCAKELFERLPENDSTYGDDEDPGSMPDITLDYEDFP